MKPNPNLPLTKSTLLLLSTLTVMSGATIAPSLPAVYAMCPGWVRTDREVPQLPDRPNKALTRRFG
jgi:hypothetical protein